ncbi:hypothetical protein HYT33_01740 [Candidatus Roizmanbacteria bacterium]|nr:hypothetical protein [Candidatus Roizmanbacteria bacterium]
MTNVEFLRPPKPRVPKTEIGLVSQEKFERDRHLAANAYQAGLEVLGVADDMIAGIDELLGGDHVSNGELINGSSHARAIDLGREVLEGAINFDLGVQTGLNDDEVIAVGELHRGLPGKDEATSPKERKRARKELKRAWSVLEQNSILLEFVQLHPDHFQLPKR